MTNPKHTDTSRDLVERLRGDWPEILVEKHWMMDSDAIDKQREEAADRIEALIAENERLREALLDVLVYAPDYMHGMPKKHYEKIALGEKQ